MGSPHVHSFKVIFNALNNKSEAAEIALTEKKINAQLPDHLNNPGLYG